MTRATIKVSIPGTPAQPGSGGESPGDAGCSGRSRVIKTGNPAQSDPCPNAGQSEPSSDTPDDTAGRGPQIVYPRPVRGTRETCLRVCKLSPSDRRLPCPTQPTPETAPRFKKISGLKSRIKGGEWSLRKRKYISKCVPVSGELPPNRCPGFPPKSN